MSFDLERSFHLASRPGRRTGGRRNTVKAGEEPAPPPAALPPAKDKPHRLARRMALAIECKRLIESGVVADAAAMARVAGVTRARMTQILNMNQLASDLQEHLLFSCAGICLASTSRAMGLIRWDQQRKMFSLPSRDGRPIMNLAHSKCLSRLVHQTGAGQHDSIASDHTDSASLVLERRADVLTTKVKQAV